MKKLLLFQLFGLIIALAHSQTNFEKVTGKNICFSDCSIIRTNVCNLKFLGNLPKLNKNEFLVIAGKICESTESNISIYIAKPSNSQISVNNKTPRYSYPGRTFYYENNSLVMESRAFYGEVVPGQYGVIWFQKELNDQNQWIESTFFVKIDNGILIESSKKISINITLELLKQNKAFEIKGIDQTSEP